MRVCALAFALLLLGVTRGESARQAREADDFRQLSKVEALPTALDQNFEFRKTKLLQIGGITGSRNVPSFARGRSDNPAIGFETSYRLYGAVTELDKRRRYGHYFDFFWRAKRAAPVTVRLEYRQEKLRSFTQAREVTYPAAMGSHKTAFAVIGDDFFSDGRIVAWRCLLIVSGRVVAEDRSYLWR